MTHYTAQQVAVIGNTAAREALTSTGLPNTEAVSFRAADTITVWDQDPAYAVIGTWNIDEIPVVVHRVEGTVHTAPPWSDEIDPLNASVRAFADSLAAVEHAKPFSSKRYGTTFDAGDHLHALLHAIDADTLADPYSFWRAVVDDIRIGTYGE